MALDVPAADAPIQEVEFSDVPPGVYAVQVLQDLNGNGKMDFDWAGLPVEPYGFSRDARPLCLQAGFSAREDHAHCRREFTDCDSSAEFRRARAKRDALTDGRQTSWPIATATELQTSKPISSPSLRYSLARARASAVAREP